MAHCFSILMNHGNRILYTGILNISTLLEYIFLFILLMFNDIFKESLHAVFHVLHYMLSIKINEFPLIFNRTWYYKKNFVLMFCRWYDVFLYTLNM